MQLTATFPVHDGELQATNIRISGTQASPGSVRFGAGSEQITGTLSGRHFNVSLAKVKLSRVGPTEWPALTAVEQLLAHRWTTSTP